LKEPCHREEGRRRMMGVFPSMKGISHPRYDDNDDEEEDDGSGGCGADDDNGGSGRW